jgi:pimeloyl-ACP methyl ester carboxylesterase
MNTSTTSTVRSRDGTDIAFDRSGQGPALILVGGATQYRAIDASTAELASLLAERFAVVHYDRRGRGDSGDTAPYAVEREIEDLEALITDGGGQALVYAMSSGGALALDAAAHGLAITKLALYDPPFIVDDSRPPLPKNYVEHLRELVAAGNRGDAVAYMMTTAAGVPPEYVAQMRDEPFWPTFEAVAHTIAYDGEIIGDTMSGNPLPRGRWAAVTTPTLVIESGAAEASLGAAVGALVDILPNAKRRSLDGVAFHEASPDLLAPLVTEFFSD